MPDGVRDFPPAFLDVFSFLKFFSLSGCGLAPLLAKGTAFSAVWRIVLLQSTVFVERNEARNREPQKSAVL